MNPSTGSTFLERSRPLSRPFFRLGITLAGFIFWVILEGFVYDILNFIDGSIVRSAFSGFISLAVLIPFWWLVPGAAGRTGKKEFRMALAASAVLFLPFIVTALLTGSAYAGIPPVWFLYAAALLFLAATEEFLCRGFMLDAMSFGGNRLTGLLLSSLAFAMLHLGNDYASFAGIVNIFLAGALFGFLRFLTNGLLYPVLIHWIWNLTTGMIFGWNVSGIELASIFRPLNPPPWGGFGPEESILMTIGTLGAIAILVKKLYLPDNDALPGIDRSV
jgi:uncharacterized protein